MSLFCLKSRSSIRPSHPSIRPSDSQRHDPVTVNLYVFTIYPCVCVCLCVCFAHCTFCTYYKVDIISLRAQRLSHYLTSQTPRITTKTKDRKWDMNWVNICYLLFVIMPLFTYKCWCYVACFNTSLTTVSCILYKLQYS